MNKASKLKRISAICAAFMFALLSIFAALVTQNRTAYKMEVPYEAKAEEATNSSSAFVYPDREILPSENLFDISKISVSDCFPGGYFEKEAHSIKAMFYGINLRRKLRELCPRMVAGELYTFSGYLTSFGGRDGYNGVSTVSGDFRLTNEKNEYAGYLLGIAYREAEIVSGVPYYFCSTVRLTEEQLDSYVVVYAGTQTNYVGNGIYCIWDQITCNKGSKAFPYQLNTDYLLEKAYRDGASGVGNSYENGFEKGQAEGKIEGREAGYKEGYAAASDDLSLGVLKGSKISATFTYQNGGGTKTITDEEPIFTYNGIDLWLSLSKYYYKDNNSDYILESADITITFAEAFTYEAFPIGFYGNSASDVYGGYFIGTDGKQYVCERDVSSNGSAFKIDEGTYNSNLQVKAIKIGFGRASDTLDGTVIVQSGQYRNGYANGYNDGETAGFSDGVKVGKRDGYEAGYNEGYSYGMNVSDGGFIKLLSATIDAPVKAFTSLLNFEVLGVNMKDFVLSILTLMFVLTIVRFCLGKI